VAERMRRIQRNTRRRILDQKDSAFRGVPEGVAKLVLKGMTQGLQAEPRMKGFSLEQQDEILAAMTDGLAGNYEVI
jgi:hypothetical protein